jgi:hypothetical protein
MEIAEFVAQHAAAASHPLVPNIEGGLPLPDSVGRCPSSVGFVVTIVLGRLILRQFVGGAASFASRLDVWFGHAL